MNHTIEWRWLFPWKTHSSPSDAIAEGKAPDNVMRRDSLGTDIFGQTITEVIWSTDTCQLLTGGGYLLQINASKTGLQVQAGRLGEAALVNPLDTGPDTVHVAGEGGTWVWHRAEMVRALAGSTIKDAQFLGESLFLYTSNPLILLFLIKQIVGTNEVVLYWGWTD